MAYVTAGTSSTVGVERAAASAGLQALSPWPCFRGNRACTGLCPRVGPQAPVERWEFTTGDCVRGSPAVGADGTVYIGSEDAKFYALDGATGAKRWEFATGDYIDADAAIGENGTVYCASTDGKAYALNGATGGKKWEFPAGISIVSGVAVGAEGFVYTADQGGNVYLSLIHI